jgi:hypothetical protein
MSDSNTPAISPDVEILYRMLISLEDPKFDWVKIGASMGLSAGTASKRYYRLRDKVVKGLEAPTTANVGPSPAKRKKIAHEGNVGATLVKPKQKRGGKKAAALEHPDGDDDELLGGDDNTGMDDSKRKFDDSYEDLE